MTFWHRCDAVAVAAGTQQGSDMRRTRWSVIAGLWVLALVLLAPVANASETKPSKEQPAAFAAIDAAFGDYLVKPFGSVLFFDLWAFDNTLPLGDGIGSKVRDARVTAYAAETGYALQREADVLPADVTLLLSAPRDTTIAGLAVRLAQVKGKLEATTKAQPIDLAAYDSVKRASLASAQLVGAALPSLVSPAVEGRAYEVVDGVAPFPLIVDVTDPSALTVVPAVTNAPADVLTPQKGDAVRVGQDEATVLGAGQVKGTLLVRYAAVTHSKASLKNPEDKKMAFIVVWLVLGAIFFTVRMGFINLRAFRHAVDVTAGKYDDPDHEGEISHFQALSSALSATVGLGNISGVALAVAAGGPGALFWMILAGFLGMSAKFVECTLGQMYRTIDENGKVLGGPMRYLSAGLGEIGLGPLGKVLAGLFAVICIGGSFGGGNMFQANQAFAAMSDVFPALKPHAAIFGVVLAIMVGLVIIGGIQRIGAAASVIVPGMVVLYVLASVWILVVNAGHIPAAFGKIVTEAFTPEAGLGGMMGVLIQGFRRAAFSNEAGVGSAAIAHSAAATGEPVREGIVASLGPFIDTIVICTMTGLVVVVTGAYKMDVGDGVLMTSAAFGSAISWFPTVLSIAVLLFAFSTMISWSYYGERAWAYLFGEGSSLVYRGIFVVFVFFGSVFKLGNVLDFSDLCVLGMAFPNVIGVFLLSGKVKSALDAYWAEYKAGRMKTAAQMRMERGA